MNIRMNKITAITIACMLSFQAMTQVVMDQGDMPVAGDTLRVSVTAAVPPGYAATAMDTTWNFSALEAMTQRVDTFVNATVTPATYQIIFVLLGGANLASPLTTVPIPNVPVTQGFTFFKNNATSFSELGSAYTLEGIPIPAKYDVPDKIYQFPMTPGLSWSSVSAFELAIPGVAAISTRRNRTSAVDGWGTVITPYGNFQTLRVKSLLNIHDSIFVDSLGSGFSVNREIKEYKWLVKEGGIPVLQVSEEGSMVTAVYRDICRMPVQPLNVSLGPDTSVAKGTVLTLKATVTGGTPPYLMFWSTLDTGASITVAIQESQSFSVLVTDALQNFGTAQKTVTVSYPPGMAEPGKNELLAWPNPTSGSVRIRIPEVTGLVLVRITDSHGNMLRSFDAQAVHGELQADMTDLAPGMYLMRIISNHRAENIKILITGR